MHRTALLHWSRAVVWVLPAFILSSYAIQSCLLNDVELLKQRRLRMLKNSILAQLGLNAPPAYNASVSLEGEESVKATFNALQSASASLDRERESRCHSEDFYAKPVTSFVGVLSEDLVPSGRPARDTAASDPQTNNLLNRYSIYFNFSLSSNLTDVSRADLLLYQQNSIKPDTFVRDRKQYIEIRTVVASLNQKFVVEGKYVDVFETGYQVFEITAAIKLWIAKRISGPVGLEVSVYCYSSPNCSRPQGAMRPASVSFLSSSSDQHKVPRIITVSKNPLDVQHQQRQKRNAEQMTGVGACRTNQSTCCLNHLELSFHDDLGLEFIVLPENFTANYCEGVCPDTTRGELMTPQIFDLFSRLPETNPGSSLQPCCTGNQYKSQQVLMVREQALIIEELKQVIVLSCRCS